MSGALILLPSAPIPSKPFTVSSASTSSSSSSTSFSLFRNSSLSFQPLKSSIKKPSTFRDLRVRADDGDADGGGPDDYDMEDEEMEEVDNKKDYDVEYENLLTVSPFSTSSTGGDEIEMSEQSKSFVSTQGWDSEMVVDYRINEQEFHKICLLECDFFIRKPPDPDNDVYDFREMYVTPPDTDVYSIPRVLAPMPQKYIRCAKSDYGCYNVTEPPIDAPRDPMYKSEREIAKVFLSKHYRNRRSGDPDFVVDFEEIYVIDSKTKSITRAKVLAVWEGSSEYQGHVLALMPNKRRWILRDVTVPGGRDRDRKNDMLIIRDNGNSFKIIDRSERADPTTVIEREEWIKTRQDMERHLRKLRDFSVSNWF